MLWMLRLMKRKRNGLFYSKKEETINSISHGIGIAMGDDFIVTVSSLSFLYHCFIETDRKYRSPIRRILHLYRTVLLHDDLLCQ